MRAVILAAGRGKRLRPATDLLPKPLLPVAGRPVLDHLLDAVAAAGVDDIAVVVGHGGELVRRWLELRGGAGRVACIEQPEQRGSGDALLRAADFVAGDDVLLVGGDTAFDRAHVRALLEFRTAQAADVALCLKRVDALRRSATSAVELAADGVGVRSFVEKPANAGEGLAAALLHVYPPAVLEYAAQAGESSRGEREVTAVLPAMIADGLRVVGVELPTAPDLSDTRDLLLLNFAYTRPLLEGGSAAWAGTGSRQETGSLEGTGT